MFKIVRHYYGKPSYGDLGHLDSHRRTIETSLTLEQAQAHCNDPETSSSTCTTAAKRRYTAKVGEWFDGYSET